jgi:hypothetical protein
MPLLPRVLHAVLQVSRVPSSCVKECKLSRSSLHFTLSLRLPLRRMCVCVCVCMCVCVCIYIYIYTYIMGFLSSFFLAHGNVRMRYLPYVKKNGRLRHRKMPRHVKTRFGECWCCMPDVHSGCGVINVYGSWYLVCFGWTRCIEPTFAGRLWTKMTS